MKDLIFVTRALIFLAVVISRHQLSVSAPYNAEIGYTTPTNTYPQSTSKNQNGYSNTEKNFNPTNFPDVGQIAALINDYKLVSENYQKDYEKSSQSLAQSLAGIEKHLIELLSDKDKHDSTLSRYKRDASSAMDDGVSKLIEKFETVQREYQEHENKFKENLKFLDKMVQNAEKLIQPRSKREITIPENVTKHDENPMFVDAANLVVKVTNKNNRDMWEVSEFLLDEGVRKSILEAIKLNLQITSPEDIKGIDESLKSSFQKIRDEAVHVDKPRAANHSHNKAEVSANLPILFQHELQKF